MADMVTDLPELPEFFKVIPFERETSTFHWDQSLPQNFETLETAIDARKTVADVTGDEYVIMSVQQKFVDASFFFNLVKATVQ